MSPNRPIALLLITCTMAPLAAAVIHVDAAAAPGGDGSSWASAFDSLSLALAAAGSGDELWLVAGDYHPDLPTPATGSFELPDGVALVGGFDGSESDRVHARPATNVVRIHANGTRTFALLGAATIEAMTLAGASAAASGGGVALGVGEDLVLRRCRIESYAAAGPGGFALIEGGSLTVEACVFTGCSAPAGGVFCVVSGTLRCASSVLIGNTAGDGGVVDLSGGEAHFVGITAHNHVSNEGAFARNAGGALHITDSILQTFFPYTRADTLVGEATLSEVFSTYDSDFYSRVGARLLRADDLRDDHDLEGPDGVVGTLDDGCCPRAGSLLIDSGSSPGEHAAVDVLGRPRFKGVGVEVGAYEGAVPHLSLTEPHAGRGIVVAPGPASLAGLIADDAAGAGDLAYAWSGTLSGGGDTTGTTAWSVAPVDVPDGIAQLTVTLTDDDGYVVSEVYQVWGRPEGRVVYLDVDATGDATGASWSDAFTTMDQVTALVGVPLPKWGIELRVAEGMYRPSALSSYGVAWTLASGTTILGGYPSGGGTPDPEAHPTVLSGDIEGDDDEVGFGIDNARILIRCSGATVLDGLTIQGAETLVEGAGDGSQLRGCRFSHTRPHGGTGPNRYAVIVSGWSPARRPVIDGCTFARCLSGGLQIRGSAVVDGCRFEENDAQLAGGGVSIFSGGEVAITRSTFFQNSAHRGGGISGSGTTLLVDRCVFEANTITRYGGGPGMYVDGPSITVRNSVFWGNRSRSITAMAIGSSRWFPSAELAVVGCTFADNVDPNGSTSYVDLRVNVSTDGPGGEPVVDVTWSVANCVFLGGSRSVTAYPGAGFDRGRVDACVLTRDWSWAGTGNLIGSPGCVAEGDAHGPDGVLGTADDGLRLRLGSPALDAGDPTAAIGNDDIVGAPRMQGAGVDIGAYEGAWATVIRELRLRVLEGGLAIPIETTIRPSGRVEHADPDAIHPDLSPAVDHRIELGGELAADG